ncbi:MAG: bifunctional phosphoglucose/phosphomannose isomerase [Bacteroidetes bacterium]|nr:bifunctional phosphoglucose/phosphomannose isomerase [Bacteroidota bacterium]
MKDLVLGFANQLTEAIDIGQNAKITKKSGIKNVIISGLGGSGIGGLLVFDWLRDELKLPFMVNKSYHLPNYANKNTLVLISSYSGNTEETVSVLNEAIQKGCIIFVITTGGKCKAIAEQNNLEHIIIPGGKSPRACIGYSIVQLLFILQYQKLISKKYLAKLKASIKLLNKEESKIQKEAKSIAERIYNKMPIVYSTDSYEATAIRWRQQINENGKQLCWHHAIPEMNHNEIVGWREHDNHLAVLFLHNEEEHIRNEHRMAINKKTISKYTETIIDVYSKGKSIIERSIYLIHLGDWISCFLADLRNVDPIEVHVIDELKKELSLMPYDASAK